MQRKINPASGNPMPISDTQVSLVRRRLLAAALAAVGSVWASPAALAARLLATPYQMKGPFYPVQLPLDHDNDLVTVAGRSGVAAGVIANVVGRILDQDGKPVASARVEIWQANAYGRYHHLADTQNKPIDPNFQGYGQFVTGADGGYRFRTIKPVPYPGRAPHIHFTVTAPGFVTLITQMYVAGAAENKDDFLLNDINDPALRSLLIVQFEQTPASPELLARFDLVVARA